MAERSLKGYHPAALEAALGLIRRAACEETAKLIEAVIAVRAVGDPTIDLDVLAEFADPRTDLEVMRQDLERADMMFARAFGVYLLASRHREFERKRAKGRELLATALGADPSEEEPETIEETSVVELSSEFVDLLDQPLPAITGADDLPVMDDATSSWAAIAAATRQYGVGGHHLLLRCADPGRREGADFAGLVAKCGVRVILIDPASGLSTEHAVLKAELHAGAEPLVVVMNKRCLFKVPDAPRNDDDWDAPRSPSTTLELEDPQHVCLAHARDRRGADPSRGPDRRCDCPDGLCEGLARRDHRGDGAWYRSGRDQGVALACSRPS